MSAPNIHIASSIVAGPRPERVQHDSTLEDVIFLDAKMILELRLIFPNEADGSEYKRIEGFRWKGTGRPVTFATTPHEEIVLDDFKNRGAKPDFKPFLRASTGVGIVSSFDQMRQRHFLVQNFALPDSMVKTLAIGSSDQDIRWPAGHNSRSPMIPCPATDYDRCDLRVAAFRACTNALLNDRKVNRFLYYLGGSRLSARVAMLGAGAGLDGQVILGMKTASLKKDLDAMFGISKPIPPPQIPVAHPFTTETTFAFPPLFEPGVDPSKTRINLQIASKPSESIPPAFFVKSNIRSMYIIDTNVTPRRHRQLAAFMKRMKGLAMIGSLPELEKEIRGGRELMPAMLRLSSQFELFRSTPHKRFKKNDVPLPQATLWPADGAPRPVELEKDLRIRAELLTVMRGYAALIDHASDQKVVVFFISFDLGHQRLATALPKVEGVELIVAHMVDDLSGPEFEDVLYGLAKPYVEVLSE